MPWEMMSLQANNNNNLTHFLSCLHSALCLIFFCSSRKARANKAVPQKHTQVILKMAMERSYASKDDRGQINKAFGYFKKMTEEAHRQPRAVPQLQHCVYLESYSWGEGKEQQSSNRARVIIFSPVCYGLVRTPSLLPGNKELQREKRNGTGPKESAHIIIKSDPTTLIITQFHFFQLGKIIMVLGGCWK